MGKIKQGFTLPCEPAGKSGFFAVLLTDRLVNGLGGFLAGAHRGDDGGRAGHGGGAGVVYRGIGPGTEAAVVLIKTDEGWSVINWAEIGV